MTHPNAPAMPAPVFVFGAFRSKAAGFRLGLGTLSGVRILGGSGLSLMPWATRAENHVENIV